jgi:hypothetical protein
LQSVEIGFTPILHHRSQKALRMAMPDLDILTVLLAAKEAGAAHVRITPDGSFDVVFDEVASSAKRSTARPARLPYGSGVHRIKKTSADGQEGFYWYAYRGGPRISEDEAERLTASARNKVVQFRASS